MKRFILFHPARSSCKIAMARRGVGADIDKVHTMQVAGTMLGTMGAGTLAVGSVHATVDRACPPFPPLRKLSTDNTCRLTCLCWCMPVPLLMQCVACSSK